MVTHAAALARVSVRVSVGYADPFYPGVQALARALPRNADVYFGNGCHDGSFFTAQEPPALAFLGRHLALSVPGLARLRLAARRGRVGVDDEDAGLRVPPQFGAGALVHQRGQAVVSRRADQDRGRARVVGVLGDQPSRGAAARGGAAP